MKLRFLTKKTIKGKQEYHLQSLEAHLALFNKMNKNFKHSLYNIHCNILYNGCPFDVFCLETQNTNISCRVPLHLANNLVPEFCDATCSGVGTKCTHCNHSLPHFRQAQKKTRFVLISFFFLVYYKFLRHACNFPNT